MSDFKESQLVVLDDAITTFGITAQIHKAIEEMAELTVELMHFRHSDANNFRKVAEELADVIIMAEQMKRLFNDGGIVDEFIEIKVERLKNRLNGKTNRHELGAEEEYDSAAACKGDDNGGDCEAPEEGVVSEADE